MSENEKSSALGSHHFISDEYLTSFSPAKDRVEMLNILSSFNE